MKCYRVLFVFFVLCEGVISHKEEECIEVGFARASAVNVEQGFQAAKETLLPRWKEEDSTGVPKYSNLSPQMKNVTRSALLLEETSKNVLALIRKTRVGKRCQENWLLKGIEKHVTPLIQLDKELAESLGLVMSFRCLVGSPYPNVDGTCVNEENPDMGAAGAKFLRLMSPVHAKDGYAIRPSAADESKKLPSARKVAELIRRHLAKPSVTSLFTEWSHFIERDTFSIPESPLAEDVDCCNNPEKTDCAPVFLEKDDPMYDAIKCFNFKRSTIAQAILGPRESLSVVSSYLDATPVYGVTNEEAFKLKTGYFGYLKYPESLDKGSGEMPETQKNKACKFPESFDGCFALAADDKEFLENLRLLFILEHNRIADALGEINAHFDDPLLYNEARRIVIAQYNAILYGEFLPTLIGKELAEKHHIMPGSEGPSAQFIKEVNPGILTSFALASHRNAAMKTEWRKEWGKTDLLDALHYNSVRGEKYQDMLSVEIQRARDHGLQNYRAWRGFCDQGKHIGTWEDLKDIFSSEVIDDLKAVYENEIEDIDMNVAMLEKPEGDAVVGKIFGCILVDQYARLRTGNRLYWEHESSMMTKEQRTAMKSQSSAAGLLCRHFQLDKVPKNPFKQVSENNPEIECEDAPSLDMSHWKDTSLIEVMSKKKEEDARKREEEMMQKEEERKKEEKKEYEKKKILKAEVENIEEEEILKKQEQKKEEL